MRRLILLMLLLAPSLAASSDDASPMSSIFLVARKDLPDLFFRDSVVLITHRPGAGPVGVIVNRPTKVSLASLFPDLERLSASQDKLFFGGPVAFDELIVVFRAAASPAADAVELIEGVYLSTNRKLMLELLARPAKGLRVYSGHAAWAPGQLESEIARGDWHLERAQAAAIFDRKPEEMWPELERRAAATRIRALQ